MAHKHVSAGWDEVKARGALEPKARVADNSECGKPKAEVKDIWRAETHQFGGGGGGREDNLWKEERKWTKSGIKHVEE